MPQPKTQTRWTPDTRLAFLLALRLTGGVVRAAAEIGRQPAVCYKVRERDAKFAAQWDAIVKEQRAARRAGRALAGKVGTADSAGLGEGRWDGLGPVKRRAFLRALAETGTVKDACARARVSDTAVFRLRGEDADFAAAWERALATAPNLLEQAAWERAVEGWDEPVFAGGKQVGTRRRFSETLMRQLMIKREKEAAIASDPAALKRRAEEAAQAAGGWFGSPATREETNAAILAKLTAIEARRGLPPLPAPEPEPKPEPEPDAEQAPELEPDAG